MSVRRGSVLTALVMLAVFAGIALDFPYAAFLDGGNARPGSRPQQQPVSFVTLSSEAEVAVMRKVRDSSRRDGAVRKVCTDLFFEELPEVEHASLLSADGRTRPAALPLVESPPPPFLPSRKAPPPTRIAAAPGIDETMTFPKGDLLKID